MRTNITEWAPIALFIYRRPEHARRTIRSLQACEGFEKSHVFVFADGPRTEAEASAVHATRATARELLGDRAVFVEQEHNRGLADSIIAGVTELCERFGAVVVVEDDLMLHPRFLRFLNEGLAHYDDEPRVMQISGYMFDVPELISQREALLIPMTTSWGWATWKRAWDLFDPSATGWQQRLANVREAKRFNLGGRRDYASMLKRQMSGEIDSWAIRWYYTVFAYDGLVLCPPQSLVRNDGFDLSGTHGRFARRAPSLADDGFWEWSMSRDIAPSTATDAVFDAVARARRPDLWRTLKAVLSSRPGRTSSARAR